MRKVVVLALAALLTQTATARVWTRVYQGDGKTPLEAVDPNHPRVYRDIMVGTRLSLVISSDTGGYWNGVLILSWEDSVYGTLSARDYSKTTLSYDGSGLEAAGERPRVFKYISPAKGTGYQFLTYASISASRRGAVPGDWFVLDYHAEQVGLCTVELYGGPLDHLETHSFNHVPSRDFNGDTTVDLADFALLAPRWHRAVDPNSESEKALDLRADGRIDVSDLAMFSEYWLERTDCPATAEPNPPAKP